MLLLDAQQAFDMHDGLEHKLIELNFPHYLIVVIQSYLSNRFIRVRVGDSISETLNITAGVPRGSKISPCLFNIYCYDIFQIDGILTAQYADDVALLRSSHSKVHCTKLLNLHVRTLYKWYQKWRIAINESKSVAVFFSKKHIVKPPEIIVNSHTVPWSHSAKYLGVILDQRLTWVRHINNVSNKSMGAFISLAPFFRNTSVTRQTKLRAFNAIIRSISTYAISIWGSAPPNRIKRVQGRFMRLLRSALGIPWYIRHAQILKELPVQSPLQSVPIAAGRLHQSLISHTNPSISSLAEYSPKSYDWVNRPCSRLSVQPTP